MSDIYIPPGGGGAPTDVVTVNNDSATFPSSYQLKAGTNISLTPASSPNTLTIAASGGSASAGGTNGQIQYNASGPLGGFTMSGDATTNTTTGVITLATTNSSPGSTTFSSVTTNGKGLVTANSTPSLANNTVVGNISGASQPPVALTATQLTTIPNLATASLQGMLPALTDAQIVVGKTASNVQAVSVSGDGTLSDTGALTVTKTNGTAFGTAATENLTSVIADNGSGGLTIGSAQVTGGMIASSAAFAGSPTTTTQSAGDNSTKISTTAFVTTAVNNAIAGVNPAIAVQAATTAAANTSALTYNNGVSGIGATFTGATNTAITFDGYTFTAIGQRALIKNDTQSPSGAFNGIYYVTQIQTAILPPILTRALDYDSSSDINNTGAIPVVNGTVNGTTSWILTSTVVNVGTDPLTYTKFTLNPATVLTSTATGLIIGLPFFMQTGTNITIQLDAYAAFGYTINAVNGIATTSGTITAAVQIGGTNVTGLSAISVTSTPQNVSASALNTVVATNQVTLVLTSNSSATNLCFTMQMTRS